jgi:hypothetical protein
VSVVSLPRRDIAVARPRYAHARSGRWARLSPGRRAAVILAAALVLLVAGSTYVAERQVQIHTLQTELLQQQASYAGQVAALTQLATPARVAVEAGKLHLVEPTTVTQVEPVPLDQPLPTVRLRGSYVVTPRVYR